MAKVLIVFGSTSGNTEMVSEKVKEQLTEHEVEMKNVLEASVDELSNFDVLLMGSSTWNDGELQDDFVPFQMELESDEPDLSGKKYAAYGCGESVYEHFCGAVDILEKTMDKAGAEKVAEGLKIDGYPDEDENVEKINEWVEKVKAAI